MKPFTEVLSAFIAAERACYEYDRGKRLTSEDDALAVVTDSLNRFFDVQRLLCMGWRVEKRSRRLAGEVFDGWFWIRHTDDSTDWSPGSHDDVPTIPTELVELLK